MGLYTEWQAEYAAHNVVTFPIGKGKAPAVTNWQKAGLEASRQWAFKFPEADAFAFMAGSRNKITVLDVDSKDERILSDALSRHGSSPIIVRSGSGNYQAWFRHNGERRVIRPRRDVPVDILGTGVVVAPPSQGSKAPYQFIQGSLDDLDRLPTMRDPEGLAKAEKAAQKLSSNSGKIGQGNRRTALFKFLCKQANYCDTIDDLTDVAFGYANETIDRNDGHHFADAEIIAQVRHVWDLTEKGINIAGKGKAIVTSHADFDRLANLGPDAVFLEMMLRRHHWGKDREFVIANAMRETMPGGAWTEKRFANVRKALLEAGIIEMTKPATRHTPGYYRFRVDEIV